MKCPYCQGKGTVPDDWFGPWKKDSRGKPIAEAIIAELREIRKSRRWLAGELDVTASHLNAVLNGQRASNFLLGRAYEILGIQPVLPPQWPFEELEDPAGKSSWPYTEMP